MTDVRQQQDLSHSLIGTKLERAGSLTDRSGPNLLVLIVLSAGAPLFYALDPLRTGVGTTLTIPILTTYAIVVVSAAALAVLASTTPAPLLRFTFWLYVYVFLGLAPLVQLLQNRFPQGGDYRVSELVTAQAIVVVGIAFYQLGCQLGRFETRKRHFRLLGRHLFSNTRLVLVSALGLFVSGYTIYSLGGPGFLFKPRLEASQALQETLYASSPVYGFRVAGLHIPAFVALLLVAIGVALDARAVISLNPGQRRLARGLLILLIALNLIVSNPISSPRMWVGTVYFTLAAALMRLTRPKSWRTFAVAAILMMLIIFPYGDLLRYSLEPGAESEPAFTAQYAESFDYDSFQQLTNSVLYVERSGHTWGRQLLGTLAFAVPRDFWSGKPEDTGELVARSTGYDYTNLAMPLWGEAFTDGGFVFVAFIFLVLGLVTSRLERAWALHAGLTPASALVPAIAAYQLFLLRGSLLSATSRAVVIALLVWLVFKRWRPVSRAERYAYSRRP